MSRNFRELYDNLPAASRERIEARVAMAAKSPEGAAMEARLIQDIDFTDEDMDRVERETASLLREGLIQRIALREAELATLREELADEQAQLGRSYSDNSAANNQINRLGKENDSLREERDRLRKAYGDLGEEANSLRADASKAAEHAAYWKARAEAGWEREDQAFMPMLELRAELSRERERHQQVRTGFNNLVSHFRSDFEDPGLEIYGKNSYGGEYLNRILNEADALLEPQPAPVDTGGTGE